jgi:hypothetical protein
VRPVRSGESVELGYDERVARSHRGGCFMEAWPCAGGSAQPVVEVDPLGGDTELGQALALGGEVCSSVEQRA